MKVRNITNNQQRGNLLIIMDKTFLIMLADEVEKFYGAVIDRKNN